MTLEDKIREDLKDALKQQDKIRVSVLRLLLSDIKNATIAQRKAIDDTKILDVISREVRRHRESIEAFKQGERSDLVSQEEAELKILMEYLPEQMSREEIADVARQAIAAVGAREMKDSGRVMSQLMPQLRGKATGNEVSGIVSELLASM
jgi:hypothetical protein